MRIYTRTGDSGLTSLGDGSRVPKTSARVASCGELDELNAALGVLVSEGIPAEAAQQIARVQSALLSCGSALADPSGSRHVPAAVHDPAWLERWIDAMSEELQPLRSFVIPGGSRAAALAHVCRAVCRRAERHVVGLHESGERVDELLPLLNRLSDALFVLARWLNHACGASDVLWSARA